MAVQGFTPFDVLPTMFVADSDCQHPIHSALTSCELTFDPRGVVYGLLYAKQNTRQCSSMRSRRSAQHGINVIVAFVFAFPSIHRRTSPSIPDKQQFFLLLLSIVWRGRELRKKLKKYVRC